MLMLGLVLGLKEDLSAQHMFVYLVQPSCLAWSNLTAFVYARLCAKSGKQSWLQKVPTVCKLP